MYSKTLYIKGFEADSSAVKFQACYVEGEEERMPSICCSYPTVFLVEPENLVHHILKDMHTTKKKKTRVILRMLPISGTCKAFMEDMKKYTETFFEPWFKAPNKGTYQIVYKARNNSHMSREEVIKELAGMYGFRTKQNKFTCTSFLHAQCGSDC